MPRNCLLLIIVRIEAKEETTTTRAARYRLSVKTFCEIFWSTLSSEFPDLRIIIAVQVCTVIT